MVKARPCEGLRSNMKKKLVRVTVKIRIMSMITVDICNNLLLPNQGWIGPGLYSCILE